MKGYSSLNTLLLPPRQPGERLPVELLDYYKEQILIEEQEQAKRKLQEAIEAENGRYSKRKYTRTSTWNGTLNNT